MHRLKTLVICTLFAGAAPALRAQDAGAAAQQVRKSAEQAAAQTSGQSSKPADKPAAKPAAPSAKPSQPAAKTQPNPKTQAAKGPAKPAASNTAQTNKPAPAAGKPGTQKPPAASGAKPSDKAQAKSSAKPAGKKTVAKRNAKPATKTPVERLAERETRVARRDPFEAMIGREQTASVGTQPLPAGKAGLQVSTLRLDGVVRAPNGMIAVVSNPQSRTYFLREGDQLYDGRVEKIAMDGVSFHEIGKDAFGKPVERQVNKRIYASAGEQQ